MTFIEDRPLSRIEINLLLAEAPDEETRNLNKFLKQADEDGYDFFKKIGIEHFGLISNQRPIYLGVLDSDKCCWTVVNSNVQDQFSLYKHTKRKMKELYKKHGVITATMEKLNKRNIAWVEKIGFKKIEESNDLITFAFGS